MKKLVLAALLTLSPLAPLPQKNQLWRFCNLPAV
jgi:hypothetical protein